MEYTLQYASSLKVNSFIFLNKYMIHNFWTIRREIKRIKVANLHDVIDRLTDYDELGAIKSLRHILTFDTSWENVGCKFYKYMMHWHLFNEVPI